MPWKKGTACVTKKSLSAPACPQPGGLVPVGEEAFQRAAAEQKLIFLSSGYSTCHWCHVMARESFTNPEIAAFLNEHFISVKVDREERPDVDGVYMEFCRLLRVPAAGR